MALLSSIEYQIKFTDDSYIPPKAKVYNGALKDLFSASTKRSAKGVLNVDRIGSFPDLVLEIPAGYTSSQMSSLLQHLRELPIALEWFDPEKGEYRTGNFYAKDRTPELLQEDPILYKEMKIGLVAYEKASTSY